MTKHGAGAAQTSRKNRSMRKNIATTADTHGWWGEAALAEGTARAEGAAGAVPSSTAGCYIMCLHLPLLATNKALAHIGCMHQYDGGFKVCMQGSLFGSCAEGWPPPLLGV